MAGKSMKLNKFVERGKLHVVMTGDIAGGKCDCLEKFWAQHVPQRVPELTIDMTGVDAIDPLGVATMINLLRDKLGDDMRVTLRSPPQVLAHTVYKIRMSEDPCLAIEELRTEEPYAG